MSRLNNHDKAVQSAMKAMEAGGAKFPKWAKALKFLSPLLTANMLFEGLRKIPGISDVMQKIDDLDAWVTKNTLGRIPVLKWNNALKKAGQNFLSGGDKSIQDYVYQGDETKSGEQGKHEENDRSWYEPGYSVTIPTNETRPVDLNMVPLFTPDKSFLGGIAKLAKLCVSGYSIYRSKSVRNTIQTIFKSMRDNLKSNITYTIDDVTCVLLNNISIYIMEKHLERRLGFTKFEDPEFKSFYDLWKKTSLLPQNYGIYDIVDNPNLDVTSAEYGISLDIYEKLVSMSDRCILPSHFKEWIDHYFGSVMIIDDDVANKKYMVVCADSVPFYSVVDGKVVENYIAIDDQVLTPEYMYDFIDSYFHESKVATIISDYTKAAEFGKIWNLSGFITGWLTSMDNYKPVPIIDKGFKQALINAYTYDGASDGSTPSYYRLDRLADVNDDLTTYLFLGKLFNNRRTTNIYGSKTWEAQRLEVLVYADASTPVYLPYTLTQQPSTFDGPRCITKDKPFAIVVQSDISADIYIGANLYIQDVQVRYYGPTNTYPVLTPATTEITCNIAADRNTTLDIPVSDYPSLIQDIYFYLPLVLTNLDSNTPILFFKRKKLTDIQIREGVVLSGSGAMGDLYWAMPQDDVYKFLVDNHLMPTFTHREFDVREESYTYGAIGNITIHSTPVYSPSIRVTFDWYSMVFAAQTETPRQQYWVQYPLYPNSDIGSQYCLVTDSGVTRPARPSINYGYTQLAATLFTMLGYSIPMFENLKVHISVLDQTVIDTYKNQILLKEDYIPFYINADDFPYVIDTMFDGLFNYKVVTNAQVKDKQE